MSVNKVILVGKLGQDPELKYTGSGKSVCNMSVATTKRFTNSDGEKEESTSWHKVIVWGKQAENCNMYLTKGSSVFIEGEISYRQYQDKNEIIKYITEINAYGVQFLGDKEK